MAQSAERMFYTTDQTLHEALLESEATMICSNTDDQCSSELSNDESDSEPGTDATLLDASEDVDEIRDVDFDHESVLESAADRYYQRNMHTQRERGGQQPEREAEQ